MAIQGRGDYLAGQFVPPGTPDGEIRCPDPGDLDAPAARYPFRHAAVDEAVEAAHRAWPAWAKLRPEARHTVLRRFATLLEKRADEAALAIVGEMGKTLHEARQEVAAAVGKVAVTLDEALRFVAPFEVAGGRCRFRSRGVLAVLGPYNFPLHLPNGHIVPALATGNCVVLKPSEIAPGVSQIVAECWEGAGLPPGVFNLVQGDGESGARLARHADVKGVLFTGSWETGTRVREATRDQPGKILALEMGGKNAAIVLHDADLDRAAAECFLAAFQTTGQRCTATSRLILDRRVADPFLARFLSLARAARIGHGADPETFLGPLATERALHRFFDLVESAEKEGAEALLEAHRPDTTRRGHYVSPGVHRIERVDRASRYQQEEIFGPDVSVLVVDGLDEALSAQDATDYGLALAIFTRSRAAYEEAFFRSEVGVLNWNRGTAGAPSTLPFGGRRRSGNDFPSALLAPVYCTYPVASLETEAPFDPASLPPGVPWPGRTP
ncbi:MAG: aldehyde dehydrogenase family protein [Deltaproteobacteria bacterium]|nr:aldehyde dehydrogenase family protein [Deltaproteobacteria bacterium]